MLHRPFKTLLIANRGEIACRIIKTARSLGLRTIAVYSEADARALHTKLADEAHFIGAAAAPESYLNIPHILEAARRSGAEAIHPGYGFLSEKAAFAEACEAAGLIFVGPPASAIHAMGSKSAAKALMEKAGVPVVPGYHGKEQTAEIFAREAKRLGFPVLLKAVAGGGGKGMRIVRGIEELDAAVSGGKREAAAAFSDDSLLMEKFVERPRHIEVQIFGDGHGNIVSLFERECTLQRRHQKVVEEAPSAALTDERRAPLHEAARKAGAAIGYVGAGTVEFVADDSNVYFIEMNTRLQVEHPVTEMITGLDLVEWQLRIAMGEKLPLSQNGIKMRGHAIEARVYAEDAAAGFLPSIGQITHWRAPQETVGLRIDTGFGEGDAVSQYYDPMLAKVIAHAETRDRALAKLRTALQSFEIAGVATNLPFLTRLLGEDAVAKNAVDTGYIERESKVLGPVTGQPSLAQIAGACAAILHGESEAVRSDVSDPYSPWSRTDAWSLFGSRKRAFEFRDKGGAVYSASLVQNRSGNTLEFSGATASFAFEAMPDQSARYAVTLNGVRREISAVIHAGAVTIFDGADVLRLVIADPFAAEKADAELGSGPVAPMPGTIIALLAKPGEVCEAGAPMLILEAMKMEHTLRFPAQGHVARYLCAVGDFVAEGTLLAEFETADQPG